MIGPWRRYLLSNMVLLGIYAKFLRVSTIDILDQMLPSLYIGTQKLSHSFQLRPRVCCVMTCGDLTLAGC